jgi:hypothetical protein
MTENNKWIKTAIVIVAVVVILESVVIISNGGSVAQVLPQPVNEQPTQVLNGQQAGVVSLAVKTDTSAMKVKGAYKVWVEMTGEKAVNLDAIDLYVKYDKSAFTVSNLDCSGMTVKPTFSKVSELKSVVVVNYFITESAGLAMTSGKTLKLVGFTVTPKKIGNYDFDISLGDDSGTSKTMLVENQTSKEVAFDSQKLTVSVK